MTRRSGAGLAAQGSAHNRHLPKPPPPAKGSARPHFKQCPTLFVPTGTSVNSTEGRSGAGLAAQGLARNCHLPKPPPPAKGSARPHFKQCPTLFVPTGTSVNSTEGRSGAGLAAQGSAHNRHLPKPPPAKGSARPCLCQRRCKRVEFHLSKNILAEGKAGWR